MPSTGDPNSKSKGLKLSVHGGGKRIPSAAPIRHASQIISCLSSDEHR